MKCRNAVDRLKFYSCSSYEVCKLYCKPCATEFDGTPCAVKAARTVWSRGKVGDYIKGLPMAIRQQESGYEAAHGWRRCRAGRHYPDSSAERPVRLRTAGGFIPPVHTQSLQSSLWITAPIIIGSELLQDHPPINERRCYYAASDPHYFCSEPSQDPYQPLHLKDGDC